VRLLEDRRDRTEQRGPGRARRPLVAGLAAVALAGATTLAAGGTASAAAAQAVTGATAGGCVAPYPIAKVKAGMTGTGLTVSRGRVPGRFTATVLGVLKDGILPGVDMILVKVDSPAIRAAGGAWAGVSGSPVYAADGRLLGALAYGLSTGPSMTVGVTPAAQMLPVLTGTAGGTAARHLTDRLRTRRTHVDVPPQLRREIVAAAAGSAAAAASGLQVLDMPIAVSGIGPALLPGLRQRLQALGVPASTIYQTSAVTPGRPAPAGSIVPGGTFAAALSTGYITLGGIGTTTWVCGNRALAFGHALTGVGSTSESAHAGNTLYIQQDPTLGPFKVASLDGAVGTVTQDRLTALGATLGPAPGGTVIASSLTAPEGASSGRSVVSAPDFLPLVASAQTMAGLRAASRRTGPGGAVLSWTVTGTAAGGTPFTLARSNRYTSLFDISVEASTEITDQVNAIVANPFLPVSVTGVRISGSETADVRQYSLVQALIRQGTAYVPLGSDRTVKAGSTLALRLQLRPYRSLESDRTVNLSVTVPPALAGKPASLLVGSPTGGSSLPPPGFPPLPPTTTPSTATSFPQLLRELQKAPTNDAVTAQVSKVTVGLGDTPSVVAGQTRRLDRVVTGQETATLTVTR
jgi:hypothetical protein